MIGTKIIEDIISTVLWTPYVQDEQAVSALILSEVEGGKTALSSQFRRNDGITFMHDATAWGIIEKYMDPLLKGEIKHIIFPEFIQPLSRKRETTSTFLAFINGLVEEGIQEIQTYATRFKLPKPIKAGVIACLAKSEFAWRKDYWAKIGFLSRFLPISYSYSQTIENDIFEAIYSGQKQINEISIKFTNGAVALSPDISRRLNYSAREMASAMSIKGTADIVGFRPQQHLQRMIKALALSEGRTIVEDKDYYKIMQMAQYMNYDYKTL